MRRLLVALLVMWCGAAEAAARRSIAVLEFRGGTTAVKNAAARLATILKRATSRRVVDPVEARRLAGAGLDAEVARCGGDARCIAGLGKKIGVDDVLLCGVSDLGDVIVALQLVDAHEGKAVGRVADSFPPGTEPDEATLEAFVKRVLPPEDFLRWGTLRIFANVEGAVVYVGGKPEGTTPIGSIVIPAPATVDVRLSKEGYEDFRASIDILPESSVEVRPMLSPKAGAAWYEKWWVWAIVGGVVAGAVTTAVIVSQPSPTSVPVTVRF
ncbi:MAG TPA: PEGA domain-containing protein [Haliangiales bacterium]|nr:PEGA domain-containing protein [Haliangiales bacterium]